MIRGSASSLVGLQLSDSFPLIFLLNIFPEIFFLEDELHMTIQKEEEKQHILIFQFDNNCRIFLFLYGFERLEHSIPIDSLPSSGFLTHKKGGRWRGNTFLFSSRSPRDYFELIFIFDNVLLSHIHESNQGIFLYTGK